MLSVSHGKNVTGCYLQVDDKLRSGDIHNIIIIFIHRQSYIQINVYRLF